MTDTDVGTLVDRFLEEHPVGWPDEASFRGARFDAGVAFPHFEPGLGGRGLDPSTYPEVENRFLAAGAADYSGRLLIGLGMAAPTLRAHGSDAQRALLRPLFTGEEVWCQLFSEPGAGSDLANLSTRAQRIDGGWLVNGQKVWSTMAHEARWGLLLARTDPNLPKHAGLTYFVLDMHAEGVDVRPLRQMTGEAEFNEVYLTDVALGRDAVLGEPGSGWRVAMTTLANERLSIGTSKAPLGERPIDVAARAYRDAMREGHASPAQRDRFASLWVRAAIADATNQRIQAQPSRDVGPGGTANKLAMAELNADTFEFVVTLSGANGMLIDNYDLIRPSFISVHGGGHPVKSFMRTRANKIEGGTSEIMRNILGERILGLPQAPRADKGKPWNQTLQG